MEVSKNFEEHIINLVIQEHIPGAFRSNLTGLFIFQTSLYWRQCAEFLKEMHHYFYKNYYLLEGIYGENTKYFPFVCCYLKFLC